MNNKNNTIKTLVELNDVTGNTINSIELIELTNGFTYYSKKLFSEKYGISERTIQRRDDEVNNKTDYWRYCIRLAGYKNFYSIGMLGIKKKNLIGRTRAEYIKFLKYFEWDLIGSIRPENSKSISSARGIMNGLSIALNKKFPGAKNIIWYNVEKNPDNSGYHLHYVLKITFVDVGKVKRWLIKYLGKYQSSKSKSSINTSIHLDKFRVDDKWLEYITKQIDQMPDGYDLLTN